MLKRKKPLQRSGKSLKRTPIRRVSAKQRARLADYYTKRNTFLARHPHCEACVPDVCTHRAQDVHHAQGRGANTANADTFIACCRACHDWIHTHANEARALGLLKK